MSEIPETQYLKIRGAHLATQVFGDGPRDLVLLRATMNHLEAQWEEPRYARFMRRLAKFARVITFDQRGMGMSDPIPRGEWPGLEMWSDDLLAVMDELEVKRATVVATGMVLYAFPFVATYPERVEAFVAVDSAPSAVRSPSFRQGPPPELATQLAGLIADTWGTENYPLLADVTPETRRWLARYQRLIASPGVAKRSFEFLPLIDVSHILPTIRIPTLVLAHEHNFPGSGEPAARALADNIPNARTKLLPGQTFWFWGYPDPDAVGDEIEEFVTGARTDPVLDRILTTVLFTDIVGSTQRLSTVGDSRWTSTLDELDSLVSREVGRHRGQVIKSTGDGHLATFDAPGRGIRCAQELRESVRRIDLRIRAGLHTGEVELRAGDLGGMAVHIGRRVCDLAGPDEVLVSAALPALVAGSGFEFRDRGSRELKGVPGDWQLFEVA